MSTVSNEPLGSDMVTTLHCAADRCFSDIVSVSCGATTTAGTQQPSMVASPATATAPRLMRLCEEDTLSHWSEGLSHADAVTVASSGQATTPPRRLRAAVATAMSAFAPQEGSPLWLHTSFFARLGDGPTSGLLPIRAAFARSTDYRRHGPRKTEAVAALVCSLYQHAAQRSKAPAPAVLGAIESMTAPELTPFTTFVYALALMRRLSQADELASQSATAKRSALLTPASARRVFACCVLIAGKVHGDQYPSAAVVAEAIGCRSADAAEHLQRTEMAVLDRLEWRTHIDPSEYIAAYAAFEDALEATAPALAKPAAQEEL